MTEMITEPRDGRRGKHRIAFVVPTMDRPDDLRALLDSVRLQKRKPHQLIVVDGSDPPIQNVIDEFPDLQIDYARVFPPSLSQQRNAGMARLRPDITLAGYLDDDIVLERDAFENMLAYWEEAPADLGGAAFNITNAAAAGSMLGKRILGVDSAIPGRVLRSGFQTTIGYQAQSILTDWLYGGATVWRRDVIDNYRYDEWFLGTGFMEDVDFSYTVRQSYRLAVVATARLAHYSRPVRIDREFLLGKWQIVNRMYLVRKHRNRGLDPSTAWLANLGVLLLNAGNAIVRGRRNYWLRAKGNIAGIISELSGRRERISGYLK